MMAENVGPSRELERLLAELADGALTDEQERRLAELLRQDAGARAHYLDYMAFLTSLHWEYATAATMSGDAMSARVGPIGPSDGGPPPGPVVRVDGAGGRARPRSRLATGGAWWATAAAVAVVFGTRFFLRDVAPGPAPAPVAINTGKQAQPPRPALGPASAGNVAVLTRTVNPVWGTTELPTEPGSALTAGRLRLDSGLIQLEFYGGAIVVLEGPADFELIATDRAFCRQGKLRARALLKSSRFSLGTPKTDVIDLGTEFGVLVDVKGGSEVQVFEGSVELRGSGPAGAAVRQLAMGEGLHIDPSGASRSAVADPNAFVGSREMQQHASTEAGRRYRAWLGFSHKLRADPRVLVYYSFEGQQPWDRTLLDQAIGREQKRNGGIVGCEWTEGRWPGKAALDFKRTSDRVRVNIPGEFDTLTLMTWVRVDYFDNRLNALLLSDGYEHNEVHWELDGRGILIFAVKDGIISYSPVVLGENRLGLWTHLATVYTPRRHSVAHYVNGQAVPNFLYIGRRPVQADAISADSRVIIGSANIGNFMDPPPIEPKDRLIRNLNGRIDEFIIMDHELDAREIRSIYEMGKPTS